MSGYTAQYPRPDHFIVHLSDTHLLGGDTTLYGVLNSEQKLRELFAELEASGARPEALVFTGDLADHGEAGAYRALRAIVEPAAARLGAQVVWVMGNHDSRGEFRSELLDQPASTEPVDRVFDINGLRIIALDSTVPGKHYGHIADHQLAWLSRVLAEPAPHGTILALHHPPIPSVLDLAASVELRGQAELAAIVRGTDVRSIIAGHLHYSTSATFAGIPVSVASATCYTQDLTVPVGGTRGRDGAQAYNLVHVYGETVLHSVVPVGTTQALSFVSAEETAVILAQQNVTIRPADNPHVAVTTPVFDAPQTRPWPAATQPATSPDAATSPDPATPPDAAALTSQGAGIG